jgi:hypothetical protein
MFSTRRPEIHGLKLKFRTCGSDAEAEGWREFQEEAGPWGSVFTLHEDASGM